MRRRGTTRLNTLPRRKARLHRTNGLRSRPKADRRADWVYEIKLDGYRAVAVKSDGGVNLIFARRKSFDHHYH